MKRTLIFISAALLMTACGNNSSTTTATTDKTSSAPATASLSPDEEKGLNLVAKSDCLTCHKIDEPNQGPAYTAVAARYKNASALTIDSLSQKIIKGGYGNWGSIPMIAHSGLSKDDAQLMVKYILSLKK